MPACACGARSSTRSVIACPRRWISRHLHAKCAIARSMVGRPFGVGLPFLADDEPRAAAERHVRPCPLYEYRQAIAETAEPIDMQQQPEPPREVARQSHPAELGDR